jgi:hypothetical protein
MSVPETGAMGLFGGPRYEERHLEVPLAGMEAKGVMYMYVVFVTWVYYARIVMYALSRQTTEVMV